MGNVLVIIHSINLRDSYTIDVSKIFKGDNHVFCDLVLIGTKSMEVLKSFTMIEMEIFVKILVIVIWKYKMEDYVFGLGPTAICS